jgi:hypothetical protein
MQEYAVMYEHETTETFGNVDEILGDAKARYFGGGYRDVNQRVLEVELDTEQRSATALARVTYPVAWSTKANRELVPHLSSIDAIIIAMEITETYLREAYGLDDFSARDCWVRRCSVRSGPTPTLQLNQIPVTLRLVATRPDTETMCGYASDLKVRVGLLTVELSVDHPLFVERRVHMSFSDVDWCLGAHQDRYYAGGYKHTRVGVSDVVLNRPVDRARALFSLDYASDSTHGGLSGGYFPFISITDAVVGTAQLAQAVLYRQDNLTRASSRNLWMRKISITIPRPAAPQPKFDVETWISHANVVPIAGQRWRTAKFQVRMPSLTAEYSVAHALPELAEEPLAAE